MEVVVAMAGRFGPAAVATRDARRVPPRVARRAPPAAVVAAPTVEAFSAAGRRPRRPALRRQVGATGTAVARGAGQVARHGHPARLGRQSAPPGGLGVGRRSVRLPKPYTQTPSSPAAVRRPSPPARPVTGRPDQRAPNRPFDRLAPKYGLYGRSLQAPPAPGSRPVVRR